MDSKAQVAHGAQVNKKLSTIEYGQKLSATPAAQLVDVRTPEEYSGGHLPGAINIDYQSSDFENGVAKLDKKKPVFVYCHSGRRSSSAAEKLEEMGFSIIYNLSGGISDWEEARMPIE